MNNVNELVPKKSTHIKILGRYVGYAQSGKHKVKVPVKETSNYFIDDAGMKFDKESGEVISWGLENQSAKHGIFKDNSYYDTYLMLETLERDHRHLRKPGRKRGTKIINGVLQGSYNSSLF